jgi:hypothetical protein
VRAGKGGNAGRGEVSHGRHDGVKHLRREWRALTLITLIREGSLGGWGYRSCFKVVQGCIKVLQDVSEWY